MKNTLRYLLIAVILSTASLLSVANATAQNLAQLPDNEMRSTSVLPTSGSTLPQAAVDGALTTYDYGNGPRKAGPRKGWGNNPGDGEPGSGTPAEGEPTDRPEPYENPIGDAALPLALLACAYLIIRVRRAKGDRTA